jgi:hypothetical protein
MLTLSKLDAFDADRLHRKLSQMWRTVTEDQPKARRVYRMMCRVYPHLHKVMVGLSL